MLAIFLVACQDNKKVGASGERYTCPMHPQIMSDVPGTCPICKMDLVPVNSSGGKEELTLSESQMQLANIQTMKVTTGPFSGARLLNARLVNNPTQTEVISSRYPGRIEKLFVRETGQVLQKGAPVLQIFSEELQTLQQDYLLQVRQQQAFPNEKIYQDLKSAARDRLLLFGLNDKQLAALIKAGKPSPLVTVFASQGGVVNELSVSEGGYVAEGSPILRLENFSTLWVEADLYPSEASDLKEGATVMVSTGARSRAVPMKVDFVAPQLTPGTQVLTIRGTISNPEGVLQPGMQATVSLAATSGGAVIRLPVEAVIRKESGAHVWVKTGKGTFAPRLVTTGAEDAEAIVITAGVKAGDEVVITGGYLLYSEFILKKGTDPTSS